MPKPTTPIKYFAFNFNELWARLSACLGFGTLMSTLFYNTISSCVVCSTLASLARNRHLNSSIEFGPRSVSIGDVKFRILQESETWVAVDKPAGIATHAPEGFRIPKSQNAMAILRDQLGQWVYPVHRLDRATSGVLLYAKTPNTAHALQSQFQSGEVQKFYFAVCRGRVRPTQHLIAKPLVSDTGHTQTALTQIDVIAVRSLRDQFPGADTQYGLKHQVVSLVLAQPLTGRMHQIRRHLASCSHPIMGDTRYGDGKHNRFFREALGESALFLKAAQIQFWNPDQDRSRITLRSNFSGTWHKVFDALGVCGRVD